MHTQIGATVATILTDAEGFVLYDTRENRLHQPEDEPEGRVG